LISASARLRLSRISFAPGIGGSISGTVKDRSGLVVPKATVTATNTDTGVRQAIATNGAGAYSFPSLPVGRYDIDISLAGFRTYRRADVVVDVNGALLVDAVQTRQEECMQVRLHFHQLP
jgi:hypothetical protein